MKNDITEISELLNEKGTVGNLRKKILSFLLCVEEINELNKKSEREFEEVDITVSHIEHILKDLLVIQQLADETILKMSDEQRRLLKKEAPNVLEIFGWQDKIDEDGKFIDRKART